MLRSRSARIALLAVLVTLGIALIVVRLVAPNEDQAMTPMDVEWVDDFGYATTAEGEILRLTLDGDRVESEVLATGLDYARGLAVGEGVLYVAELGPLPCENPIPRCKGEHVGPTTADGERQLIATSGGRVLAYPIDGEGQLGDVDVLVDEIHFTNSDHGLNDLDLGPDGLLYLPVGNLDQLAWDDDGNPPSGPETEHLGSILRIDPATGELASFATGLRNVFGLSFDEDGQLWGVDNDGPSRGVWRAEELLLIEEGLDYGFPDDGTVGPYSRRTGYATWIMPTGAGSSGLLVEDGVVYSGACGRMTRVRLDVDGGDAAERQVTRPGCVTAVERLPDGRFVLATVYGDEAFTVVSESELFDD